MTAARMELVSSLPRPEDYGQFAVAALRPLVPYPEAASVTTDQVNDKLGELLQHTLAFVPDSPKQAREYMDHLQSIGSHIFVSENGYESFGHEVDEGLAEELLETLSQDTDYWNLTEEAKQIARQITQTSTYHQLPPALRADVRSQKRSATEPNSEAFERYKRQAAARLKLSDALDAEYEQSIAAAVPPEADSSDEANLPSNVEQRTDRHGAKHLFYRDGSGKLHTLGHNALLEAYGYKPNSAAYKRALAANLALKAAEVSVETTPTGSENSATQAAAVAAAREQVKQTGATPGGESIAPTVKTPEHERVAYPGSLTSSQLRWGLRGWLDSRRKTDAPDTIVSVDALRSAATATRRWFSDKRYNTSERWADYRYLTQDRLDRAYRWRHHKYDAIHDRTLAVLEWTADSAAALYERVLPSSFTLKVADRLGIRSQRDGGTYYSQERREWAIHATKVGAAVLATAGVLVGGVAGYKAYESHERAAQAAADRESQKEMNQWCAHFNTSSEALTVGCFDRSQVLAEREAAAAKAAEQPQAEEQVAAPKVTPPKAPVAPAGPTQVNPDKSGFQTVVLRPGSGEGLWRAEALHHPQASDHSIWQRVQRDKVANHITTDYQLEHLSGKVKITR